MITAYIKLGIAAAFPVLLAAFLYFLDRKTAFGRLNPSVKQVLYGVLFGLLAIVGTEWGIPINGAQTNCRDAAVLTAGLFFGAPAGIIAGVIGGAERWFAVLWGVGTFTRVACALSTVIAGLYAAFLRRFLFENKRPGWLISFAIGVVMEIFHLTMVFITNMATPIEAMAVVKACTLPMVLFNGISVMLSSFGIALLSREKLGWRAGQVRISQMIQRWLLVTVMLAFATTSFFVFRLQSTIADTQTDTLLGLALDEVASDIRDASDQNMLELARQVAEELEEEKDLRVIAGRHEEFSDISIIDRYGYIQESTNEDWLGFYMGSGNQSEAFLCLLEDTEEYVQAYGPISYDVTVYRKYAGVKYEDGFIQIGYDAEHFQKDIDSQMLTVTKNRHVGNTGFLLVLDGQKNVISAPKDVAIGSADGKFSEISMPKANVTFAAIMNGEAVFCRYRMAEGYYIVSVLPEAEALQMRNIALYVNTFMEILVFAILFGLIYFLIKRVVVDQLRSVNRSLAKITNGNLDEVVDVRTNEEFASLSDDINSTVATLKRYIAEASARIDKELEFAKNIQSSALPSVSPAYTGRKDFDIYALMDPAKEVGGDFYDFYMPKKNTLHFLVADVSGKGIPAAMFMMRAKTELRSLTEAGQPIADVFTGGNKALCEGNAAGMFVTAWQGGLDLETGLVSFANAGHNPPLVRHGNGKFEYLRSRAGFVLAGMDSGRYRAQELQLAPGDTVFLYTDGVTEATDAHNELY
ncbi:MAG: SpoIIE family protein phosphatase, partial [Ruminococcus sp.]|nr:SpoIIE family protein phosphatase [Candidatus Apopatosoma intestinale]